MPTLMTKSDAHASAKKLNKSLMNLAPTALITLFEIDIDNLVTDRGLNNEISDTIIRLHNNVKLLDTSIRWRNLEYTACPIHAQGFELNGRGTLPTPKLSLSVSSEGILAMAILKTRLRQLDDLIGAKVTRIRTYAENLDPDNFGNFGTDYDNLSYGYDLTIEPPELPRDVYYIDRKSAENKNGIEFELASILDIEGVKLPARVVYANRCPFTYRREGCLYEYPERLTELGSSASKVFGDAVVGDLFGDAPPVANDKDESIEKLIGMKVKSPNLYNSKSLADYTVGNSVYITKNFINYYFVCKFSPVLEGPPNLKYWIADTCSKSERGCKLRFGENPLRFGGYLGCDKVK